MSPTPPLSLDPRPLLESTSVQHVALADRVRAEPGRAVGSVVLQTDRLRQLALAVLAGHTLPRHEASCDATVTVLAGTGALTLDDDAPVALRPGVHLVLPAGTPHAVEAGAALVLLATFAEPEPEIRFHEPA